MKVAKWKVLGVAGALVLGYAVSSQAFQLKVDDDTFMNVNYRLKVRYQNLDKRTTLPGAYNVQGFDTDGLIAFSGQINDLVQFYADWTDTTGGSLNWDAAYINFAFAPEFQIKLGGDTVPFSILKLQGSTAAITPVGYSTFDPQGQIDLDNIIPGTEGLAEIHGSLADGMINYAFTLFNQNSPTTPGKNLNYAIRLDFTPTMWGYCGGYGPSYLGKKDVMNLGVAYVYMKDRISSGGNVASTKGWTVDFTFEKNLGAITPSFQVAYFNLDDTHFVGTDTRGSEQWTVQAQLLYNDVVGIGKPAIAFRYDKIIDDSATTDAKVTRYGAALNYYIEGNAAKVSLGFNKYTYGGSAETSLKAAGLSTKLTDWYLFAQVKF